jgi:hypothetical protein
VTEAQAEFLLRDLARWTFGEVLAQRADFRALSPEGLAAEVRAYRYGILCAAIRDEALRSRSLAEPLVGAAWDLMLEWSDLGLSLPWDEAAERALSAHFVARLEQKAPVSDAMRRFARGKAFKYGRRVSWLFEKMNAS